MRQTQAPAARYATVLQVDWVLFEAGAAPRGLLAGAYLATALWLVPRRQAKAHVRVSSSTAAMR